MELFNKNFELKLNEKDVKNIISIKAQDYNLKSIEKYGIKFPEDKFLKYLKKRDINNIERKLFFKWKKSLPENIHNGCVSHVNDKAEDYKKNCIKPWMEFQLLYMLSGVKFVNLIEKNKSFLNKNTIRKLAELFYHSAFVFKDGVSQFKVGGMCEIVLKQGLKKISDDLKNMELNTALEISNENLKYISERVLFNSGNEHSDVLEVKKDFWSQNKSYFQTKLISNKYQEKNIDYYIQRGIKELLDQGSRQYCISNIKSGTYLEEPFQYFFKSTLSQIYECVTAESTKNCGRVDLKICDPNLPSEIIIEFKGWWNRDKRNIISQVDRYLTDFDKRGYIFIINHLKRKEIIRDYKTIVTSNNSNYVKNSWKPNQDEDNSFTFFSSKHILKNKEKEIKHFIFNVKDVN